MENNKLKNSGISKETTTSQNNNYESEKYESRNYENVNFKILKNFVENVNKQNYITKSKRGKH